MLQVVNDLKSRSQSGSEHTRGLYICLSLTFDVLVLGIVMVFLLLPSASNLASDFWEALVTSLSSFFLASWTLAFCWKDATQASTKVADSRSMPKRLKTLGLSKLSFPASSTLIASRLDLVLLLCGEFTDTKCCKPPALGFQGEGSEGSMGSQIKMPVNKCIYIPMPSDPNDHFEMPWRLNSIGVWTESINS